MELFRNGILNQAARPKLNKNIFEIVKKIQGDSAEFRPDPHRAHSGSALDERPAKRWCKSNPAQDRTSQTTSSHPSSRHQIEALGQSKKYNKKEQQCACYEKILANIEAHLQRKPRIHCVYHQTCNGSRKPRVENEAILRDHLKKLKRQDLIENSINCFRRQKDDSIMIPP